MAVNPVTNKIYVPIRVGNNLAVIDGTNNTTSTVTMGTFPNAVAINPITNKVYVSNFNSNNVTVIDGINNSTSIIAVGALPSAIDVNPVRNKVYVATSFEVTVITPVNTSAIPLNTTVGSFPNNTALFSTPVFEFTATSTFSPTAPPPTNIYFHIDTVTGTWTKATNTATTATTLSANGTAPILQPGMHTVYFFATDGSDATSINPLTGSFDGFDSSKLGKDIFKNLAPLASPVAGGINAYHFLVPAAVPTAANVTVAGRVSTAKGRAIPRAIVSMSDANGIISTARVNQFG